ncbi:MAG: four-carbon acid sugar kinase family protein [Ferruginibacter sp.]
MEKSNPSFLKLAYYGDDFTGSTDVMESLALMGIPTVLFMEPPTTEAIKNFGFKNKIFAHQQPQVVGVAGVSRSFSPEQLRHNLPDIFNKIAAWNADYFHYKICSTFDSSPQTGSIGLAIDIAAKYFESKFIPLLVGMPRLNRFVVFGNLFARVNGATYRLDSHPTMSKHPITPMDESDLLRHLKKQSDRKSTLIDVLALDGNELSLSDTFNKLIQEADGKIIFFDTLNERHFNTIGNLLSNTTTTPTHKNQLIVGSSAVEHAIFHQTVSENKQPLLIEPVGKADKMLVMSGSCSPVTAGQIQFAKQQGFHTLAIDPLQLLNDCSRNTEEEKIWRTAVELLEKKVPVIIYSALGPDDTSVADVKNISGGQERLPSLLGNLLGRIVENTHTERVLAVGGDTSGKIILQLQISALEFLMPVAPGAPMCLSHSANPAMDNLQIILKGGQNGDETFFKKAYLGITQN